MGRIYCRLKSRSKVNSGSKKPSHRFLSGAEKKEIRLKDNIKEKTVSISKLRKQVKVRLGYWRG